MALATLIKQTMEGKKQNNFSLEMWNQATGPFGHSWWCFISMEHLICAFQTTFKSQWVLCWPSSDAAMRVLGRWEGTLRLRYLLLFSGVSWQTRNSPDFSASTLGSSQSCCHPNWFFSTVKLPLLFLDNSENSYTPFEPHFLWESFPALSQSSAEYLTLWTCILVCTCSRDTI